MIDNRHIALELRRLVREQRILDRPIPDMIIYIRDDLIGKVRLDNNPILSNYFKGVKEKLVLVKRNQPWINPIAFGQILSCIEIAIAEDNSPSDFRAIHPQICRSSQGLYLDGHYANAAVDAFIEINDRAKDIYRLLKNDSDNDLDGVALMNRLFGKNPLVIMGDNDTDSGKSIQQGYHFMFSGAVSAMRNPKAHSNRVEVSAEESMRRLMFASLLMYKLDEIEEKMCINTRNTKR